MTDPRLLEVAADVADVSTPEAKQTIRQLIAEVERQRATLAAVRAEAEAIHGKRIHRLDSYGAGLNDAAEAILALLDAP